MWLIKMSDCDAPGSGPQCTTTRRFVWEKSPNPCEFCCQGMSRMRSCLETRAVSCPIVASSMAAASSHQDPRQTKRMRLSEVATGDGGLSWSEITGAPTALHIQEDISQPLVKLSVMHDRAMERLSAQLNTWPVHPTTSQAKALSIIALYFETNVVWNDKSDLLMARVVACMGKEVLRAHSDAVRRYDNGAWGRVSALPADMVQEIETAINMARFLCSKLALADIDRNWDAVFVWLRDIVWADYSPVQDFDLQKKHWANTVAWCLGGLAWRLTSARGNGPMDCYAVWFQEPMPVDVRRLNFTDATIEFSTEGDKPVVKQVPKNPSNNVYQHMDISLGCRCVVLHRVASRRM